MKRLTVSHWFAVAAAALALGAVTPAQAQALPKPPGGGIMEMMAWQNQFNRWLGQVGDLSAYGIPRSSTGGSMQDAMARSQAVQQYLNGLGRQYGLKPYNPMGKRLEDWMDWFDDLNRLKGAPTQPRTRDQVISRLRLLRSSYLEMARFYYSQGDTGNAAVCVQNANRYTQQLRRYGVD